MMVEPPASVAGFPIWLKKSRAETRHFSYIYITVILSDLYMPVQLKNRSGLSMPSLKKTRPAGRPDSIVDRWQSDGDSGERRRARRLQRRSKQRVRFRAENLVVF